MASALQKVAALRGPKLVDHYRPRKLVQLVAFIYENWINTDYLHSVSDYVSPFEVEKRYDYNLNLLYKSA